VDDPALPRGAGEATEQALLASLPRDRFTILLKHRPTVEPQSRGLFDLQLSGHVHKGQIFPFNLITHLVYPVKMGLSGDGAGSLLYVSRGSGTWGPPLRVLAPPEVTVIDLLPAPR
jgi:predicted MPP superfamily phosphohydrolase